MKRIPATTVSVALMVLLFALDLTVVATALPTITSEFHGSALYGWVFSAYAIPVTVTTLLYGRLADMLGRRRLFTVVVLGFLCGSVLCGLAQSMAELVVFRIVQGLFAGAIFPLAVAVIADTYPLERRAQGFSIVPTTYALAAVLGPTAGGFLADTVGWRWIFFLNVPIIALALAVFLRTYPGARYPSSSRLADLDIKGFAVFATGIVLLLLALSLGGRQLPWISGGEALLVASALILLGLFVRIERRARLPLLPLRILTHAGLGGALVSILLLALVTNTMIVLIPNFAQGVLGGDARSAGAVLIPLMLCWSITANIAVRLGQRIGFRYVAACGTVALGAGLATLAEIGMGSGQAILILPMLWIGLGAGLINPNMMVLAQHSVSDRDQGLAGGLGNFAINLGAALAAPILVSIELQRFAFHLGTAADPAPLLTDETRRALIARIGAGAVTDMQRALGAALHEVFLLAFVPVIVLLLWLVVVVPNNARLRRIRLAPLGAARTAPAPPQPAPRVVEESSLAEAVPGGSADGAV